MARTNQFHRESGTRRARRAAQFHREALKRLQVTRFAFADGEASERQLAADEKFVQYTARSRWQERDSAGS
jgi:hypothetical protein